MTITVEALAVKTILDGHCHNTADTHTSLLLLTIEDQILNNSQKKEAWCDDGVGVV